METSVDLYEFVRENTDVLELYDIDREYEDSEVLYVVCSDCVVGQGKTLNTGYNACRDLKKFSPEIFVKSREDGQSGQIVDGLVRIEVYNYAGVVVGEREVAISELGHSVEPGYSFCPYVMIDAGVKPRDVEEVRVFIVCN